MREYTRLDDIGLITAVKPKGFGFAENLTGNRSRSVFLNESRIASLAATASPLNCLIRMTVVEQLDHKLAATHVELLDLDNSDHINLLWGHVNAFGIKNPAIQRLQSLAVPHGGSVPLVLLLALRPFESNFYSHAWVNDIGVDVWRSEDLLPALHLANDSIKRRIILERVRDDPPLALATMRLLALANACPCDPAWLETLWVALPESRSEIVDLVSRTFVPASAIAEPYKWARRAAEADRSLTPFWAPLAISLRDGSQTATEIPEDWIELRSAPWEVLAALISQKLPELSRSLKALEEMRPSISSIAAHSSRDVATLGATDRRLAEMWIHKDASEEARPALRLQMLSARFAEKIAKSYFERLGHNVEDISGLQLTGADHTWRTMDLRIDSKHGVDVKNVRRSPNGGTLSSRWRVKNFKLDSRGSHVLLCGVSSPYMPTFDDAHGDDESGEDFLVLGVTTTGEINNLLRTFCGMHELRTNPATRLFELPAWAWDYPHSHYRERDITFRALNDRLCQMGSSPLASAARSTLPPVLRALWGWPLEHSSQSPQEFAALTSIQEYSARSRLVEKSMSPRLPWLYLFLLHFWMSWRVSADEMDTGSLTSIFEWGLPVPVRDDHDHWMRRIMRPSRLTSFETPALASSIGIMDPSDSIGTLLRSLARLEKHVSRELFLRISDLTLHESGVLTGRFPDSKQKTLLAHCGGKRVGGSECGYRPLVFGEHDTCSCGRLVCPRCDSCSDARFDPCPTQTTRFTVRDETLRPARIKGAQRDPRG